MAFDFLPAWLVRIPVGSLGYRSPSMCSPSPPHLNPAPTGRPYTRRRKRGAGALDDSALPWFRSLDYRTTVALIPAVDSPAWLRIQEIRRDVRAIGLYRWFPHVNILYPFLPPRLLETATPQPQLLDIVTGISMLPAFFIRLRTLEVFIHRSSVTLFMCPDTSLTLDGSWEQYRSPENMCSIAFRAVQEMHPEIVCSSRPFRPHMSVARFESLEVAQEWHDVLSRKLDADPIIFRVTAAHVLARRGTGPFQGVWDVPLRLEGDDPRACTLMERSSLPEYYHPHLHELYPCEYAPPSKRQAGNIRTSDYGRQVPDDVF